MRHLGISPSGLSQSAEFLEHPVPSPACAALPVASLRYNVQAFLEVERGEDLAPWKEGNGGIDYLESVARSSLELPCEFPMGSICSKSKTSLNSHPQNEPALMGPALSARVNSLHACG